MSTDDNSSTSDSPTEGCELPMPGVASGGSLPPEAKADVDVGATTNGDVDVTSGDGASVDDAAHTNANTPGTTLTHRCDSL